MNTMETFAHGSAAGYELGCRSAGGCPNHGSAEWLTCKEAAVAHRSDFALAKLPAEAPIARKTLEIPKTPKRVTTIQPSPTAPRSSRSTTIPGKPGRRPVTRSVPVHGTVECYRAGCYQDSTCPATPTCAEVNLAHAQGRSVINPTRQRPHRNPTVTKRELVHGTVHGWRRGCRIPEECPSARTGGMSCSEVKRKYYADYRASRRAGEGPKIKHGTPSGYQVGCHNRVSCPGGPDGTSCADASLVAERQRRRARGIQERQAVVDSKSVVDHIAALRTDGMPITEIIARSGVGRTAIRTLIYGRDDYTPDGPGPRHRKIPSHIEQRKAKQILAVTANATVHRLTTPLRLQKAS